MGTFILQSKTKPGSYLPCSDCPMTRKQCTQGSVNCLQPVELCF